MVTVVVPEKNSCSQARSRASKQPAQLRRGKLFPAQLKTLPKATAKTPPGPAQGHPLPGLLCGKGGGRRGGARSCRRPPGPVSTREGMFLPPPARPARAACRTLAWQSATPGRVRGMLSRGGSPTPPPHPTTNPHFPFAHKRVPRKPGCVQAWRSAFTSVTQGTNHPRPEGVAHHALSGPSSLPRLTKCLDAHSSEARKGEQKVRPVSSASMHLSLQGSADTQGSPHAQTRTHPPCTPASQPRNAVGGAAGRPVQTLLLD